MTREDELAKKAGQNARRRRAKGAARATKKRRAKKAQGKAPKFNPVVDDRGTPNMTVRGDE